MILQQKNSHDHETDDRQIERHVLRVSAKRGKPVAQMSTPNLKCCSNGLKICCSDVHYFVTQTYYFFRSFVLRVRSNVQRRSLYKPIPFYNTIKTFNDPT